MVQWLAACGLGPPVDAIARNARVHRGHPSTDPDKPGQHPQGIVDTKQRDGMYFRRYEYVESRVLNARRLFVGDR